MTPSFSENKGSVYFLALVQEINPSAGQLGFDTLKTKYTANTIFSAENQNNGAVDDKFSVQTNHNGESTNIHNTVTFSQ